jgi:hypothetical protein
MTSVHANDRKPKLPYASPPWVPHCQSACNDEVLSRSVAIDSIVIYRSPSFFRRFVGSLATTLIPPVVNDPNTKVVDRTAATPAGNGNFFFVVVLHDTCFVCRAVKGSPVRPVNEDLAYESAPPSWCAYLSPFDVISAALLPLPSQVFFLLVRGRQRRQQRRRGKRLRR